MFAPCPHCGFLIALIATGDRATLECPRCHNLVEPASTRPPVRSVPGVPRAVIPLAVDAVDADDTPDAKDAKHARDASRIESRAEPVTPGREATPASVIPSMTRADSGTPAMAPRAEASPADRASVTSQAPTREPEAIAHDAPGSTSLHDDAAPTPAMPTGSDAPPPASDDDARLDPGDARAAPLAASAASQSTRQRRARNPRTAASPSFVRMRADRPAQGAARRWPARAAALVLGALLVVQLLLAQRDSLARDAQWRPLIAALCTAGLCTLPPWREPTAFTMLARNVSPVAGTRVLDVQARFRNDAAWPQPWPHLHLVLSDAQGRPVAARVFTPREYAGRTAVRPIGPRQSVDAQVRITEPGPASVAFAFDFR